MLINKTALFLHGVFLLLYVISEFMNFSLSCHPGGVFAIVYLFNVKWNSLLLLKQMNGMFTCLYYLPPSQILFQYRVQADSTMLISAAVNRQGRFSKIFGSLKNPYAYLHLCILQLTRRFMRSSLLCYLTYLSCCFQPTWLD